MASQPEGNTLLECVARYLAGRGVGVWRSTGVYAAAETGLMLGALPQSPDGVISLASYAVSDDPALSESTTGVQVTVRAAGGDPRGTDRLAEDVFDALHGLHDVRLPASPGSATSDGIWVVQCLRQSGTSLGQDANARWRTVQNFYVTHHRPTTWRT